MDYFLYHKNALRANNAQLAEKKFIVSQYRSRAEIARSAIFFIYLVNKNMDSKNLGQML